MKEAWLSWASFGDTKIFRNLSIDNIIRIVVNLNDLMNRVFIVALKNNCEGEGETDPDWNNWILMTTYTNDIYPQFR